MGLQARIVRFLAVSAWDMLVPDIIDKPLKLGQNFYHCFLATDPQEKLELLREAQSLSDTQVEQLADALAAEWKAFLPNGRLSDAQRGLVRQLVRCLHVASHPTPAANPSEALRQSLNGSLLVRGRQPIAPVVLQPDQQAVGRSLIHAALAGRGGSRGPRPLPPNAPQVPGYNLLHVLGDGGFSVVYLASHVATGELRALKIGPLDDPGRFRREVRMLGSLSGPNIVRYHEHGELPGRFWIAMEYLGEYTLADLIGSRPTAEQALLLAEQVLHGLDSLHRAGVIHRDLKPENAMVGTDFRLKLIDFGLAKPLPGSAAGSTTSTTAGLIGTPRYMSPEQIRDTATLSPAADLWAFGCILYELLTGKPPFESSNVMALGHEIMTKEVRVDRPEVPEEVRPFLERCLERDPAKRWPNAGEALREFTRVAGEARRRLRHERYRERWGVVLEKHLLERFAAEYKGRLPIDGTQLFIALARREGIAEVDEERLNEILGPIFASQEQVEAARQVVLQAKQNLQQELSNLTGEELTRRGTQLHQMEEAQQVRQREMQKTIHALLAEELRSWEEKRRLDAAEARRRAAVEAHLKAAEENASRQKEEVERRQENMEKQRQVESEWEPFWHGVMLALIVTAPLTVVGVVIWVVYYLSGK